MWRSCLICQQVEKVTILLLDPLTVQSFNMLEWSDPIGTQRDQNLSSSRNPDWTLSSDETLLRALIGYLLPVRCILACCGAAGELVV